ncbi:MAG: PorP/SprF family type IX secretion system membrane protein [Saprospiraceae bacterium]
MKLRYIFVLLAFLGLCELDGQDVHYSYYQFAPTIISPAFTGAYYGNIRATAITRGQWFNVRAPQENGNQGFSSTSLFVDGNLPFGLKEDDWISLGINILIEGNTAGIFDTKRSFNGLSAAYHLSLSKKANSVLTASFKYGSYGLGFTPNSSANSPWSLQNGVGIQDDDDFTNMISGISNNGDIQDNANDLAIGFMLTTPVGKNSDMRIGIASDHLLQPRLKQDTTSNTGPNVGQGDRLTRRFNAYVQYFTDLSEKLTLNPSIVYQGMGPAKNILLQGLIGYTPNPSQDVTLNFGLGVRIADNMDVPIYVGADFKDWRVGLAFDTNVSGLTTATGNAGAYELAVSKIFSWEKKTKVNPKFICPRL